MSGKFKMFNSFSVQVSEHQQVQGDDNIQEYSGVPGIKQRFFRS